MKKIAKDTIVTITLEEGQITAPAGLLNRISEWALESSISYQSMKEFKNADTAHEASQDIFFALKKLGFFNR